MKKLNILIVLLTALSITNLAAAFQLTNNSNYTLIMKPDDCIDTLEIASERYFCKNNPQSGFMNLPPESIAPGSTVTLQNAAKESAAIARWIDYKAQLPDGSTETCGFHFSTARNYILIDPPSPSKYINCKVNGQTVIVTSVQTK